MSAPSVYVAINAITAELSTGGIPKNHTNDSADYKYRSIDDVLDRLSPLLAKHQLCVLPRTLDRIASDRSDEQNQLLNHVALRVAFTLISVSDGTSHIVEAFGEALDGSDKATAKAMSAAYKSAMVQTFCIPVAGAEEADRSTHRLARNVHHAEPPEGWRQWCLGVEDIVSLCETEEAISRVQDSNRTLLKALSREQPLLYAELGQAFTSRREVLEARVPTAKPRRRRRAETKIAHRGTAEVEHA